MNEDPNADLEAATGLPDPDPPLDESDLGPLLEYDEGEALEAHDRKHPGPGGEPTCPTCGAAMVRSVEQHRAPRSDDSPFRVRLVCSAADCRSWTAYSW